MINMIKMTKDSGKYRCRGISAILACMGTYGLAVQLTSTAQGSVCRGIFLLPVLAVLYVMYRRIFEIQQDKRFYFFHGVLSILYAVLLVFGGQLEHMELIGIKKTGLVSVLLAAAVFPVLCILTKWMDQRREEAEIKKGSRMVLAGCFVCIVIVWFAGWLAMFPGVYATDAPYWYKEFSGPDMQITSRYSPLYCFVFYALVQLGISLYGTSQAGFGIFSLVQMVFILYVLWELLRFLSQRLGNVSVILSTVFFTFIPTHIILALCSAQDPVFAACLMMAGIRLLDFVSGPDDFWKSRKKIIPLFFWMVLFCMIRNNGFYALAVLLLFAVVFVKNKKKAFAGLIVSVMAVVGILQGPVYDALGIYRQPEISTMLSLPLQQMAYAYNYDYDSLSLEDRRGMQEYISDEGWKSYILSVSDPVKGAFTPNENKARANMGEFIRLYLRVFCSSPKSYFYGAGLQTLGLWYPDKIYPDLRMWHAYLPYQCYDFTGMKDVYDYDLEVKRKSLFPAYDELLEILFGYGPYSDGSCAGLSMAFSEIPVWGLFCKPGIYTWMLMYLSVYAVYRKCRDFWILAGLEIGVWLTVFLSPAMMYRYVAPVIFTLPLYVAAIFLPCRSKMIEKADNEGDRNV